jgi:hypothetical protein
MKSIEINDSQFTRVKRLIHQSRRLDRVWWVIAREKNGKNSGERLNRAQKMQDEVRIKLGIVLETYAGGMK